ncbi:MAG: CoA ester lyase [Pseudomonadota bacterium]
MNEPLLILRSVLYVPADNERALAKAASLDCDAVIFDLEDAVAPAAKETAREALRVRFKQGGSSEQSSAIRVNGIGTAWFTEDLLAARSVVPDAIVVPKVSSVEDLRLVEDALSETDAPASIKIWAMIETVRGVSAIAEIAGHAASADNRLAAMIVGTNDLFKEAGISGDDARALIHPWLMQIVLAAKANGIAILDGVYNDFRDLGGYGAECDMSARMGFDGKTLIHPSQIIHANSAFGPDPAMLEEAQQIADAFALPENADKGVISLAGKMVERLHLDQALELLDRAKAIEMRRSGK